MDEVLLTIGIPTYNRCKLLDGLLNCIANQLNGLNKEEVQIVISDNQSTDDTKKLVDAYRNNGMLIDYSCNDKNIGANNNILKIGNELAKGKYCWILGDDDLIREGGVNHYLNLIRENQDINVFYLNHTFESDEIRDEIKEKLPVKQGSLMCRHGQDELLPNGEAILGYTTQNALFTCISSFIFKKKIWQDNFIGYQTTGTFEVLSNTFPHSVVLSAQLMRSKVYYVNHPYLAFFVGSQDWFHQWELLLATRVLELTDLFERNGASKGFLKEYRQRIFNDSFNAYYRLYTDVEMPAWFNLELKNNIKKYFKYACFRRQLKGLLFFLIKQQIKKLIKHQPPIF
ncbi:glycosyltransferase family 2 protein [Mucilaginibacter psychrotolerans]|uniref:Glycosyltransferase family 2 protein n=1 Tax=Mucilaginibacter psychrotolerans TaxID=1524096 RepID=A0A4Y8SIB5_9SPHI|nr:glycosyltransferase family A protein [Mucilaginibacter psychrotolerans]TFF38823.1 glycosyltransferase family 2 protein [Mucilaginibacter psychrotolerans]